MKQKYSYVGTQDKLDYLIILEKIIDWAPQLNLDCMCIKHIEMDKLIGLFLYSHLRFWLQTASYWQE